MSSEMVGALISSIHFGICIEHPAISMLRLFVLIVDGFIFEVFDDVCIFQEILLCR